MRSEFMRIIFVSAIMLVANSGGTVLAQDTTMARTPARAERPTQAETREPTVVATQTFERGPVKQEITPPAEMNSRALPDSTTLRAGPNSAVIQSLKVKRELTLTQVRQNPKMQIGSTRVNMTPVLNDSKALFNVAQRIRLQPLLAEVIADNTQVYEVEQGLIVRSFLTYQIKPGVCSNMFSRTALGVGGVNCTTRLTSQSRAAAFANPKDAHYVADPALRAQAIADAETNAAQLDAELNANVAQLRVALSDRTTRAEFEAEWGQGQAERMSALSDDQLKEELVNTAATSIEQTTFVPRIDRADTAPLKRASVGKALPSEQQKPDVDVATPMTPHIILTGFTLGKKYEWKVGVEKEIGWCKVYCHTYYVGVHVSFGYDFGLRFPISLGGTYRYHYAAAKDGKPAEETAKLTPTFVPINGSAADYAKIGLPGDKVHEGKEVVANVFAIARAGYDLPGLGSAGVNEDKSVDFTKEFTGDFYDGQFTPPAPKSKKNPNMTKTFDDIDLLGGQATFGVFGAKVHPGFKLELQSESLTLNLHDIQNNTDVRVSSGDEVNLNVRPSDHASQFALSDPEYKLNFLITPGILPKIFVDVAIFSAQWVHFIPFPQLEVKLPSSGIKFGCHADTVCSRNYTFTPTSQSQIAGPEEGFASDMEKWGYGFDAKWVSECPDDTCRYGLKFVRQGTIYSALHKWDANPAITLKDLTALFAQADEEAKGIVNEGQARQTKKASKSYSTLMLAIWSKRCSDSLCLKNMKGIIFLAQWEMNAYQDQHPDLGTSEVIATAGKKFVPSLQAEVDASKARVAAEEALKAKRASKPGKPGPIKISPIKPQ